jgi:hypothetical protein
MPDYTKKSLNNQQLTGTYVRDAARIKIQKMWRIFCAGNNSVFELRALWPKGVPNPRPAIVRHYRVADYPSLDDCKAAFEQDALALNASGYNIYTLLNPLNPAFTGNGGAQNSDILYRDLLLIDIDRTGETSNSATETEVNAAKALAIQIRAYMFDRGWSNPIALMSGNGYHLYYVLEEIGNEQTSTDLIKLVLNELAAKFDNATVSVDTCVHNASRITKVPGTLMRKGAESLDRPYRIAEVCDEL